MLLGAIVTLLFYIYFALHAIKETLEEINNERH